MTLNKKRLKKLRKLNKRLFYLEYKIINEAIKLDKTLQNRSVNPDDLLDDYEIEVVFDFYIKGSDTPIATINEYLKHISTKKEYFNHTFLNRVNHNEFLFKDHPMSDDYHCWLFHSLYDHINLSWKIISKIKNIYVDISVKYQYMENFINQT